MSVIFSWEIPDSFLCQKLMLDYQNFWTFVYCIKVNSCGTKLRTGHSEASEAFWLIEVWVPRHLLLSEGTERVPLCRLQAIDFFWTHIHLFSSSRSIEKSRSNGKGHSSQPGASTPWFWQLMGDLAPAPQPMFKTSDMSEFLWKASGSFIGGHTVLCCFWIAWYFILFSQPKLNSEFIALQKLIRQS